MVESSPVLSVVVPVGSAGPWFDAAIDSIRQQTWTDLEIVLVLDGPGEAASTAARHFAQLDPRVVLVPLDRRSGAGAARNAGLAAASGSFLAFADADDVVPRDAYAAMIGVLRSGGADLVSGRAEQFAAGGDATTYWSLEDAIWREGAVGRRLRDTPQLVSDHTPWNKVFRREWLVRSGVQFPTGTTCEDVSWWSLVVTRATVDVLPEVVYRHRRHDASVTSGITLGRDLADWTAQTHAAVEVYRSRGEDRALAVLAGRLVRREAWTRVRAIAQLGKDDARALSEFVRWVGEWAPERTFDALSRFPRTAYALLLEGEAGLAQDFVVAVSQPARLHDEWPHLAERLDAALGPDDERAAELWRELVFGPVLDAAQRGAPVPVAPEIVARFWDEHVRGGGDEQIAGGIDEHERAVLDALRGGSVDDVAFLRRNRRARAVGRRRAGRLSVVVEGIRETVHARFVLGHGNGTTVLFDGVLAPGQVLDVPRRVLRGRIVVELRSDAGRVLSLPVTLPPSLLTRVVRRSLASVGADR